MRIRTIKPEFFKHDGVAALPPLTRILFIGLWCLADRDGRLEDRPKRIAVEVLPYDTAADVDAMLNELAVAGLIVRYRVNAQSLIQIPTFSDHQRITGKEAEKPSKFPPFALVSIQEAPEAQQGNNGEALGKQQGNNGEAVGKAGRETEGKRNLIPAPPAGGKEPDGQEPTKPRPPKPPRQRDDILDALATVGGGRPDEVTQWGPAIAARTAIAAVCPFLTADEIARRAANYRTHFEGAALTPTALAKHWALCAEPKRRTDERRTPTLDFGP